MKHLVRLLSVLIMIFGTPSCSDNDDSSIPNPNITFTALLDGVSEVPPNNSTATGTASLTFNTTTKVFTISVSYSGVTAVGGHIHKAAVGQNGGVVFPFSSTESPINYTSDALDASMETDLKANLYYVNIHSSAFPGGEIRGQLIKKSSSPSTY